MFFLHLRVVTETPDNVLRAPGLSDFSTIV